MEIIAYGYVSVYEMGGRYSLNIRDIEVQGKAILQFPLKSSKGSSQPRAYLMRRTKKRFRFFQSV